LSARRAVHTLPSRRVLLALAGATALLTACAPFRRAPPAPGTGAWSGRLSMVVRSDPVQSLSASFELRGSASQGELRLASPLGTTLAEARWQPGQALLQAGSENRHFASMTELLQALTGAALPLGALFDWLDGKASEVPGWVADLSGRGEGRLLARRLEPHPPIELRIRLDP
jgi:outer membrane lipoprotein LolB